MKPSTLIVWLLVAACLAIDLAMIGGLQVRRNEWPEAEGIVGLALFFTQIGLIACWIVFGRYNIALRTVTGTLGLFVTSYLASYSTDGSPGGAPFWFAFSLLLAGPTVIFLGAARGFGYELASGQQTEPSVKPTNLARQFTLWGLMSLMTATAVLLGAIRFAKLPAVGILAVGTFTLIQAFSSCSQFLMAMLARRWWLIVLFIAFFAPVAGVLLFLTHVAPDANALPLILCQYVQAVLMVTAVQILKQSGHVLIRIRKPLPARASESLGVPKAVEEGRRDEL